MNRIQLLGGGDRQAWGHNIMVVPTEIQRASRKQGRILVPWEWRSLWVHHLQSDGCWVYLQDTDLSGVYSVGALRHLMSFVLWLRNGTKPRRNAFVLPLSQGLRRDWPVWAWLTSIWERSHRKTVEAEQHSLSRPLNQVSTARKLLYHLLPTPCLLVCILWDSSRSKRCPERNSKTSHREY